jgi:hypothetical protein
MLHAANREGKPLDCVGVGQFEMHPVLTSISCATSVSE